MPDEIILHLRAVRQARRLSVRTVADAVGMSKTMLAAVETGQAQLTLERLRRLADYFQMPPWDLVTFPAWPRTKESSGG